MARGPRLDLRLRRPPRGGGQLAARPRRPLLLPGGGCQPGGGDRGAPAAGRRHPRTGSGPRDPAAHRGHRPVHGRGPDHRPAGSPPPLRRRGRPRVQPAAHSPADRARDAGSPPVDTPRHPPRRGRRDERGRPGRGRRGRQTNRRGRRRCPRHDLGIPLRRRRRRGRAPRHGRLPGPQRRPPAMGQRHHPGHRRPVVRLAGRHAHRGRVHPRAGTRRPGRARRRRRPPRRAACL